jgi:predicted DCC family thiol-disulfide oxidoreductase YuxK
MHDRAKPIVLYDGECAFCRACIAWARRRDSRGQFAFLPYQEADETLIDAELRRRCERAVHVLLPSGEAVAAGRAVLFVLERLPKWRWVRLLRYPPFLWAVELGYRTAAFLRPTLSRFIHD